jgi:hypothetical protein
MVAELLEVLKTVVIIDPGIKLTKIISVSQFFSQKLFFAEEQMVHLRRVKFSMNVIFRLYQTQKFENGGLDYLKR